MSEWKLYADESPEKSGNYLTILNGGEVEVNVNQPNCSIGLIPVFLVHQEVLHYSAEQDYFDRGRDVLYWKELEYPTEVSPLSYYMDRDENLDKIVQMVEETL